MFPSAYAITLCSGREAHPCANTDQDGMFHILGVPGDLFMLLNEGVFLAAQTSPALLIDDLEARIQSWEPPSRPEPLASKEAVVADDFLHACRAWKSAILIYIHRIFRDTKSCNAGLQTLVRECITSIASVITKDIRKQLVWCLFVAGSEIVVDEMKEFVLRIIRQIERDIECHFVKDAGEQMKRTWQMREANQGQISWKDALVTQDGDYYLFG